MNSTSHWDKGTNPLDLAQSSLRKLQSEPVSPSPKSSSAAPVTAWTKQVFMSILIGVFVSLSPATLKA